MIFRLNTDTIIFYHYDISGHLNSKTDVKKCRQMFQIAQTYIFAENLLRNLIVDLLKQ